MLSARDPGAGYQLAEIAHCASEVSYLDTFIFSQMPAFAIFDQAGLDAKLIQSGSDLCANNQVRDAILREATRVIARTVPDAILVGLSGPDCGIDEAIVASAGDIPTYAFQDYWGDVNLGFGRVADTFFVIDDVAAAYTRERLGESQRIVICGSPKHATQRRISRAHGVLSSLASTDDNPSFVFLGQPLWGIEGYARTLSKSARYLYKYWPEARFRYRPHPKEDLSARERALSILAEVGYSAEIDQDPILENTFLTADLACTCYSSCALDLAYLNKASATPLCGMLMMLFEQDVRRHYVAYSGLRDIPLSLMGLTKTVWNELDLSEAIELALGYTQRKKVWLETQKRLSDPLAAASKVLETIVGDLRDGIFTD